MITVENALLHLDLQVIEGSKIHFPVQDAMGLALAEDVYSPINMPPFQQSAMDGYAIRFNGKSEFELAGEIKAGDNSEPILGDGMAIRIFTGAPVPKSAQAVVRQEDTRIENSMLFVDPLPKPNANIRLMGEQIKAGVLALKKGHVLNAASIGFLATLGIPKVAVYKKPRVSILITGNELVDAGAPLKYGQIYESNAPMLAASLYQQGITKVEIHRVRDDFQSTKELLNSILQNSDVVICSGGISVGDYDFVGRALKELGVDEVFYKVQQKPGKPLFFGKKEEKLIFALPGNPAAALTCFYIYVVKALNLLMGKNPTGLLRTRKNITADFERKGDRAQFLKAAICGDEVQILEGQSSAMLHTFALANALVYVPLDVDGYKKGEQVECILLP